MKWSYNGPKQPESCQIGNLTIYRFADGHATGATDDVWVSASFASPEAALSWSDDFSAAERAFADLNPPTGQGENHLPERSKRSA